MIVRTLSAFADEISPDLGMQLTECARHGLDAIELRSAFGKNVMDLTDHEVGEIMVACRNEGLRVQGLGSPIGKVRAEESSPDAEDARLARALEIAELLAVDRVRIFLPEFPEGTGLETVAPWVEPLVRRAGDAGVILLHENDARYWGAFPANAQALFAAYGGEWFRAAFDFANTVLIGYRPVEDWLEWIVPHLDTLHIKDARVDEDGKGAVVPAGQGDGQMSEAFRLLEGWEGNLAIEPHLTHAGHAGGFTGVELFAQAVRALRELQEEGEAL